MTEPNTTTKTFVGAMKDYFGLLSGQSVGAFRSVHLGNTYTALGRHAEALKLREQTLALRKAKLGADNPDTYDSAVAVCSSLEKLGRANEIDHFIDFVVAQVSALAAE